MDKSYQKLLIKSLDTELSSREKVLLDSALNKFPELRKEEIRLRAMRDAISQTKVDHFDDGFTDRVMARIPFARRLDFSSQLFYFFRPVAVAAMLMILIVISINIFNSNQVSISGIFGVEDVSPEEAFNPLVDLLRE